MTLSLNKIHSQGDGFALTGSILPPWIDNSIFNSNCILTNSSGSLTQFCSYSLNKGYIINILDSSELLIYFFISIIIIKYVYKTFFS